MAVDGIDRALPAASLAGLAELQKHCEQDAATAYIFAVSLVMAELMKVPDLRARHLKNPELQRRIVASWRQHMSRRTILAAAAAREAHPGLDDRFRQVLAQALERLVLNTQGRILQALLLKAAGQTGDALVARFFQRVAGGQAASGTLHDHD